MKSLDKRVTRGRRHKRVRAIVSGTSERPRLVVFRSAKHISVQLIDDVAGRTLAHASDIDVTKAKKGMKAATVPVATEVGTLIAQRAKKAGITTVVFDRGGHAYHGQVKAVADGARSGGLTF